jgi:hypothetical protein
MRRWRFGLILVGLVAAACSSGASDQSVTYTDPAKLSLLTVPEEWNLYELGELSGLESLPFIEEFQGLKFPAVSAVAFDGAPSRAIDNVTTPLEQAAFPIGAMAVRTVGEIERDFLSRAALSQAVLPYYQFADARELQKEDFSFGAGFDGVRLLVSYTDESGQSIGVAYLIAVSDPADRRMYSIVAGCSRQCFVDNQTQIEKVVDSWLVNTKAS